MGANPPQGQTETHAEEAARRGVAFCRAFELDWLFFRRWRLPDGWLEPDPPERALEIFHDPLAIAMRKGVVGRLWPELPR